ncbi:DNA-primase RepB domain-containing protein [Arsenicibacter rosenii]|uniref:Uncharacterized protein n=1 Tax=Arsenicibacter rosenii TaxID=1750698 RepID=A0A1S2VKB4_9BACT|nr:DNA-primase RepB domain-containing protein [Arsenicibacter rosenii]OIN58636.1 hypothetical protein BLX24_13800 [Arsenicibacter rosenii]
MTQLTADTVASFIAALQAPAYKVQLHNRSTDTGYWVEYSPLQLQSAVGFLRGKNAEGFDIYCRPVGHQYVLLDDLTKDRLAELATLLPCLLLETSPANYQAWLILSFLPENREQAKAICQELATRFGADMASAEPDHVGRLPGFTNRKEKHRQANGLFPFVRLHRWQHRLSTFHPCGGAVFQPQQRPPVNTHSFSHSGKNSTSEYDFARVCSLIRLGWSDQQIITELTETSPDIRSRKGKHTDTYIRRTIQAAHKMLSIG